MYSNSYNNNLNWVLFKVNYLVCVLAHDIINCCSQTFLHFHDLQDDDINNQCQVVERLNEQIVEQEELIAATRRDYEAVQMEMTRIQAENDSAKDEVRPHFKKIYC